MIYFKSLKELFTYYIEHTMCNPPSIASTIVDINIELRENGYFLLLRFEKEPVKLCIEED